MEKIICTLEFKEGRPVAEEHCHDCHYLERVSCNFHLKAENSIRKFEIEIKDPFVKYGKSIYIVKGGNSTTIGMHRFISEGDRFTAIIENNIVTKIELT
jgi:hypothetical protein